MRTADRDLSPTTTAEYRRIIDRHLIPNLGGIRLEKLTARDLDRLYWQLAERGLGPASVHQVHAVIRRALTQAVKWGWLDQNPAALASPPKVRRRDITAPELDDIDRVVRVAEAWDPDFAVILRVAAAIGARRGELCGLQWADITGSSLLISRAVVDVGGKVLVKDTKTHASRRVELDPGTGVVLEAHRGRMVERATIAGTRLVPRAYVFSRSTDGATPLRPEIVTRGWTACSRQAGVTGVRLHDLRHWHASMLLSAGIPVQAVAARLGHAQVSTTLNIYAHVLEGGDAAAAAVVGRILSGTGGAERSTPALPPTERPRQSSTPSTTGRSAGGSNAPTR